jgi:biotin carboxylase
MSPRHKKKDLILFVNSPSKAIASWAQSFKKEHRNLYKFGVLISSRKELSDSRKEALKGFDVVIKADFDSPTSMTQALKPYEDQLLAVTARGDMNIPFLQKTIPHVPYLKTPTVTSLEWATNKLLMRRRFATYDKTITPKYSLVKDYSKETLKKVEEKVGFPLIVKPTGLASSLLVSICYHKEELEDTLARVFKKINGLYKKNGGRGEPQVLVEQFMEGDMYSIDGYVNSRGKVYFCPMVSVKTGKQIGFDDFFGYQQMTPTALNNSSVEDARYVALQAIHALGLRSSSAHVELMKTEAGWKVIELGPRLGGFRDEMYKMSYGIDHAANDIFIRIPKVPIIPRKRLGYTAVLKVFAKKEGSIQKIIGIKKIQELKSFKKINIHKEVGDRAVFAKHGGESIFNIYFFNESRSKLLADIRRMEQMVKIEVE